MVSKLEKILLGLIGGGTAGAVAGTLIGKLPPFTLNPENPSALDLSNQVFATAVGLLIGEIAGGTVALASTS